MTQNSVKSIALPATARDMSPNSYPKRKNKIEPERAAKIQSKKCGKTLQIPVSDIPNTLENFSLIASQFKER